MWKRMVDPHSQTIRKRPGKHSHCLLIMEIFQMPLLWLLFPHRDQSPGSGIPRSSEARLFQDHTFCLCADRWFPETATRVTSVVEWSRAEPWQMSHRLQALCQRLHLTQPPRVFMREVLTSPSMSAHLYPFRWGTWGLQILQCAQVCQLENYNKNCDLTFSVNFLLFAILVEI